MKRGFSLIEFLVVAAILAILIATGTDVYSDNQKRQQAIKTRLDQGVIEIRKIIDHPTDSIEIDNGRIRDALKRVQGTL